MQMLLTILFFIISLSLITGVIVLLRYYLTKKRIKND